MVFPLKLPMKDPTITFQIYDKDILSIDDFISEGTIDFQKLAAEAFENDSTIKMYQKDSLAAQAKKNLANAMNEFDPFKKENTGDAGNADEQKKKDTVASGEKVEIMLQNAKKEGYVIY